MTTSTASHTRQLPTIAVVGCGAAAQEFFLPLLQRYPNHRDAVVLVDHSQQRAKDVARQYGMKHTASHHTELPIDVEAAILATPHHFHAGQACDFLNQGKHVLVEKPLATKSCEVAAMLEASRNHNAILMVNNYRRLFPAYKGVRERLQSGDLGKIKRIVIRDGTKFAWKSASAFYVRDTAARGVFLDRGAHTIDVLCWWLGGEPEVVTAQHDAGKGVEGVMSVQLKWQDAPLDLLFSRFFRLDNDYRIECERGTIHGRLFNFSQFQIERYGKIQHVHLEQPKPHYEYAWQLASNFIEAVNKQARPLFEGKDVGPSIRVIERAYQAASPVSAPWYDQDPNIRHLSDRKFGRVLVTGATGFLGGWIVESFQLAGIPVRAGVRSWNNAVRLARHAIDMADCDVLSRDQLRAAMNDCEAVVHCAVGDQRVTEEGTRNVLAVAQELGIAKIVHLSSVAVYGKVNGILNEQHPRQSFGNPYAQAKIDAEHVVEDFLQLGLSVIALRPSIIYGPFGEAWTVSFVRRLFSGRWGTFGLRGEGYCNLVYVTDVVQAIAQALFAPAEPGFYNVNGDERMTWNDFFCRFNEHLGHAPLRPISTWPIVAKARLLEPVRSAAKFALHRFGSTITRLHAQSALAAKYMGMTESSLKLTPTREQLKLYGIRAEYPIDKARQQLGYAPRVGSEQGLAWCAAWAAQQGLTPSSGPPPGGVRHRPEGPQGWG
jgi:predicted dehydrogenase/nucleoside-diphosphate-sugar epimerase